MKSKTLALMILVQTTLSTSSALAEPPFADGTVPTGWDAVLAAFGDGVEGFIDGNTVVIRTSSVPDHGSPYFERGDGRYERPHAGMAVNPNRIVAQDLEFRVPLVPEIARRGSETRLGPIGVATNGVVFFNQYAGRTRDGWVPLEREIRSFDAYNGHPQRSGVYHYHLEPVSLTESDKSVLIGVMRDGFPIYGPLEQSGTAPVDLDDCNGHIHPTAEFPEGIYHYHATEEVPYLVGCFKGKPGLVSR